MPLDPKYLTLKGLLQGRLFRIPDYQRGYAWSAKQRTDLFKDIREVQRTKQEHFMATVVCLEREKHLIVADELQSVDVVDGQQRLTTFVILLKAIQEALKSEGDEGEIKREIDKLLVKGDKNALVLLQTNQGSTHIFLDYLRKGEINSSNINILSDKNLIDAINECQKFVDQWIDRCELVELVTILNNRFSLIYHQITDESTVYRVFEVLNSRGLDVKWIDKFKSQLMALIFDNIDSGAPKDALEEMHNIWKNIYRILGLRDDLGDQALRFAGTWKSENRPNRLLSQEDATNVLTNSAAVDLATVIEIGQWLRSVVDAVCTLNQNVRLRAVTRIVHARFLATAILLRDFPEATEDKLMREWERVTFRIFGLGGADSRHKVGDYVRLGHDIIAKGISDAEISKQLERLGDRYSIDEVLDRIDWSDRYDGWSEELRYLLFRYDEYLALEQGIHLNEGEWNKIWQTDPSKSIEHIKPQNSKCTYVHHLGNLTMLPPGVNSSLKDKKPKNKAESYFNCGLKSTVAVGNNIKKTGKWRKKDVEARAREIEKFVRAEWGK